MAAPKISVLISVWNGGSSLEKAVQSILDQTFPDFELIIVDDGSTDQTVKLISDLQKKDKRIFLKSIPHSGLAKALNEGLKEARGEYIARMDADDLALPERFQKQIQFLDQHPEVGVLGTSYQVIQSNGERVKPKMVLRTIDFEIKKILPKFNPFFHGSVMMRRPLLESADGYDERFTLAQDYDLWFRLSRKAEFANLNEVLMLRNEDQRTTRKESRQNWFGIRARLRAISQGNSNPINIIYTIRPFLVAVTPIKFREFVRKIMSL